MIRALAVICFAAGLWRELMPVGLIEHRHPLRVLGLGLSAVLDLAARFFLV
jgi:hypothetical protein